MMGAINRGLEANMSLLLACSCVTETKKKLVLDIQ